MNNVLSLTLIFCLFILAFMRIFLLIVTVQGSSMTPALRAGDRVLVLRYWPLVWLKHNQIVLSEIKDAVALPPKIKYRLAKTLFIKRIVGLPGETMDVQLSELPETWRERESEKYNSQGHREWHIPPKHYFLRGDGISSDSLIWGPIPMRAFRGLVIATLAHKKLTGYGKEIRVNADKNENLHKP